MEKWVRDGAAPPPSRYPRLQDGTLVRATVAFPDIPGVVSPRKALAGARGVNSLVAKDGGAGTPLPLLVPQVDADGNELAGIRVPEVAVPLATTTGWNFRAERIGNPSTISALLGSYMPAATRAERLANGDPRPSLEERYSSKAEYVSKVKAAAEALVQQRLLLAEDVAVYVNGAEAQTLLK